MLIVRTINGLHLSESEQRIIQSWKAAEVSISPYDERRERTNQQNRYLWGVVYKLVADHTGHSTEEIHEYCKWQLLTRTFIRIGKDERYIAKSTRKLSTDEFSQYVEAVRAWASMELGVSTPDPKA